MRKAQLLNALEVIDEEREMLNQARAILGQMGCVAVPVASKRSDDVNEVFEAYFKSRENFFKQVDSLKRRIKK